MQPDFTKRIDIVEFEYFKGRWCPLGYFRGVKDLDIVIYDPTLDTFNGWLSPEGDLYPCMHQEHNELQVALERRFGIPDLEKVGWIKLAIDTHLAHGILDVNCWFNGDKEPTQMQLGIIHEWCDKYNRPLPYFFKKVKIPEITEPKFPY